MRQKKISHEIKDSPPPPVQEFPAVHAPPRTCLSLPPVPVHSSPTSSPRHARRGVPDVSTPLPSRHGAYAYTTSIPACVRKARQGKGKGPILIPIGATLVPGRDISHRRGVATQPCEGRGGDWYAGGDVLILAQRGWDGRGGGVILAEGGDGSGRGSSWIGMYRVVFAIGEG